MNLNDFSYDYKKLKSSITNRTKLYCSFNRFSIRYFENKKIINKRNIAILEDCCESQGKNSNQKVGNFGLGGSFSFYWGHHMSTIEGGMITNK